MYKLYNVKSWGSLAIQCVLEEMEVPYTNIWLDPQQGPSAELLAANPLGWIPSLGLPDGRTLFDSAAIVSFLVAAHPGKHLSPEPGSPEHGEFLSLLHFMAVQIHAGTNLGLGIAGMIDDASQRSAITAWMDRAVDARWQYLETRLVASGPWLMGRSFSALDPYAFMLSVWARPSEAALHGKFPAIAKLASALRARPKLKAVLESHGVLAADG